MDKHEPVTFDEIILWVRGKLGDSKFHRCIESMHKEIATVDPDSKTYHPEIMIAESEKQSATMMALLSLWAGEFGIHFNKIDRLPKEKRIEVVRNYLIDAYRGEKADWDKIFGMAFRDDEKNRFRRKIAHIGGRLMSFFLDLF